MITRIITAVVALCVFVPICIFSDTVIFPAATSILACVAVGEIWNCIKSGKTKEGAMGNPLLYLPAYILAFGMPLAVFILRSAYTAGDMISLLACGMFLYLLYMFGVAVFSKGKIGMESIAVMYMMNLYVIAAFTCLVLLRYQKNGAYLYLLPFVGAWVSDTFAYFTGRFLGKHKLIPEVSPKKTIEGSIGGIVFTALAFAVYGWICHTMNSAVTPNYGLLVFAGALVSVISQIGDLIASVVKRNYAIKDYGKLFPGHGGVMDRFDSVLATAPLIFILISVFSDMLY